MVKTKNKNQAIPIVLVNVSKIDVLRADYFNLENTKSRTLITISSQVKKSLDILCQLYCYFNAIGMIGGTND